MSDLFSPSPHKPLRECRRGRQRDDIEGQHESDARRPDTNHMKQGNWGPSASGCFEDPFNCRSPLEVSPKPQRSMAYLLALRRSWHYLGK